MHAPMPHLVEDSVAAHRGPWCQPSVAEAVRQTLAQHDPNEAILALGLFVTP